MKIISPRANKLLFILAYNEAKMLCSTQLVPEHVILALLKSESGIGYLSLLKLGVDIEKLKKKLIIFFDDKKENSRIREISQSRRYLSLFDLADIEASALHNDYIGTEHILIAAVRDEDSVVSKFFSYCKISLADLRAIVIELQNLGKSSNIKLESKNPHVENIDCNSKFAKDLLDKKFLNIFESVCQNEKTEHYDGRKSKRKSFLSEYSIDLTKLAREKKTDPVVGRGSEIHRVIQILSRRTKNNPVLTGEPGVGKTSVVEGLAQKIADGEVPENLENKKILSLDMAAMVAGTKYRGEFEERMKNMMKELRENKDIILFIDELHTIIGAGSPEGTMDASNILKPALSRGEIQIIGATTTKEYTRYIEKDLALERRFQLIKVEEPDDEETECILNGIKLKYENYHNVVYDDDVIPAIVKLSRRYIPEKVLPDKAIDVLDEAGAAKKIQECQKSDEINKIEISISELIEEKKEFVKKQDYENAALVRDKVAELKYRVNSYNEYLKEKYNSNKKRVTVSDIENVISEMTGIPVRQLTSSESERIIHMEDELHKIVIGQNNAVSAISGAVRRSKAGISSPDHPIGSFIFLGPTGVGKTQLAKALAKYLFGSEDDLIRVDMSDFMEKHTASRLVGAPPGYIGYEEGGLLTEKVRRHPYSVVLLDEIEKAHPDIFNLLLQILEEGELDDNLGHTVNFRNTVIIMTSNAGSRNITNEGKVGFGLTEGVLSYDDIKINATGELKKILSPELLNRIDDIVVFNILSKNDIANILDIQLKELSERLKEKKLSISVTPEARQYLIENGYNPSMGARPMKKLIRNEVENPIAMELLAQSKYCYDNVSIDFSKNKIVINLTNEVEKIENKHPVEQIKFLK